MYIDVPESRIVVRPVDACGRVVYNVILLESDVLPLELRDTRPHSAPSPARFSYKPQLHKKIKAMICNVCYILFLQVSNR